MKKVADEMAQLRNYVINFVAQIVQVLNFTEENQQVHIQSVKYVLHWSVN